MMFYSHDISDDGSFNHDGLDNGNNVVDQMSLSIHELVLRTLGDRTKEITWTVVVIVIVIVLVIVYPSTIRSQAMELCIRSHRMVKVRCYKN